MTDSEFLHVPALPWATGYKIMAGALALTVSPDTYLWWCWLFL